MTKNEKKCIEELASRVTVMSQDDSVWIRVYLFWVLPKKDFKKFWNDLYDFDIRFHLDEFYYHEHK